MDNALADSPVRIGCQVSYQGLYCEDLDPEHNMSHYNGLTRWPTLAQCLKHHRTHCMCRYCDLYRHRGEMDPLPGDDPKSLWFEVIGHKTAYLETLLLARSKVARARNVAPMEQEAHVARLDAMVASLTAKA